MPRISLAVAALAATLVGSSGALATAMKPAATPPRATTLPPMTNLNTTPPPLTNPSAPVPGSVGGAPTGLSAGKLGGCSAQVPRPPGC